MVNLLNFSTKKYSNVFFCQSTRGTNLFVNNRYFESDENFFKVFISMKLKRVSKKFVTKRSSFCCRSRGFLQNKNTKLRNKPFCEQPLF
ncbi:hypothetical protein COU74_02860 [Candidatus Peregrinibacteria bacterium CG10_big_fil_rev_8_21_14_0_10_36_19]|nr:MAG: hypothetical protein COU74_02860 [Candidatus Peregrinibacteria bacterium CG10_big_fil_rev_8_21_14_0_10_36_19]